MRLVIATIFRRFDIERGPGFDPFDYENHIEDRGLLEIHSPLSVILKRRSLKGRRSD
jgi:hypothetical protein